MKAVLGFIKGDATADRVVPPRGLTARLTVFVAAAMALLAVLALALAMTTQRTAEVWAAELAQSATLRLPAGSEDDLVYLDAALEVLRTTPGVVSATPMSAEAQEALLAPWFGPDVPLSDLPLPQLVTVVTDPEGYDADALQARLAGQVPGAVLDDHAGWRAPLVAAAGRISLIIWFSIVLIVATVAAMITLAAQVSLAANLQVIRVLRLVGARDVYIARAFVRRLTLRALAGATAGTVLGVILVMLLPDGDATQSILLGVGFAGAEWLWLVALPLLSAIVAFVATRTAALAKLKEMT